MEAKTNVEMTAAQINEAAHETARIAGKIGKAVEGEQSNYAFSAIIGSANFMATEAIAEPEARKAAALLYLSMAVNTAFTVGLSDEELSAAILEGQRGADMHALGQMVAAKREEAANG